MDLIKLKAFFVVVIAVVSLIVASPVLQRVLVLPREDFFTEFAVLGSGHKAENYPFDIDRNKIYNVYLELTNQLGSCALYQIEVKMRNSSQSAPNSFAGTPSNLPSLYNIRAVLADRQNLELPINFGFDYSIENSVVFFNNMVINVNTLNLNGQTSTWDSQTSRFNSNLFFELWIYNSTIGAFQYHQRFVSLSLNMTG